MSLLVQDVSCSSRGVSASRKQLLALQTRDIHKSGSTKRGHFKTVKPIFNPNFGFNFQKSESNDRAICITLEWANSLIMAEQYIKAENIKRSQFTYNTHLWSFTLNTIKEHEEKGLAERSWHNPLGFSSHRSHEGLFLFSPIWASLSWWLATPSEESSNFTDSLSQRMIPK